MSQHSRVSAIARLIALTSIFVSAACGGDDFHGLPGTGGSSGGVGGKSGAGGGAATGGMVGTGGKAGGVGGSAGGTGGSSGGAGSPGGRGGTGNVAGGGAGGTGGGGAEVDSGTDGVDAASRNGVACTGADQCSSGYCVDGVCCDQPCSGVCYTCTAPGSFGICVAAATGTDPRDECDNQGAASCGTSGKCNGAGACAFYAGGACGSTTPACNAASSAIVDSSACDGMGSCVPNVVHDCNGYRCQNAACGTGPCTRDDICATHAFCSASACVAGPSNLAGNGDVEYGDTTRSSMSPRLRPSPGTPNGPY